MQKKRFVSAAATIASLVVILQGCVVSQAPVSTTSVAASTVARVSTAVPSPSPAASATVSMGAETLTPSPTPIAVSTPATTKPTAQSKYVADAYAATDGKYLYYFADNGVHRMDMKGGNDKKLAIKDCYTFLAIDATGLYCLVYDGNYTPDTEESDWQWCNSFNLIFFDTKLQKIKTIRSHVYEAVEAGGTIYMIDHMNHSRIYSYGLSTRKTALVKGLPGSFKDFHRMSLEAYKGKVYVACGYDNDSHTYLLTGNTVDTKTEMPDIADGDTENEPYQINYDSETTISVWTGSEYKDLGLKNVDDADFYGSKLYIMTEDPEDNAEGDLEDSWFCTVTLYEATTDGNVKKLAQRKHVEGKGEGAVCVIVGGWFFGFWLEGDGGTACGLALKYNV